MIDKRRIIDLCLRYNEANFCRQDFRQIDGWIAEGCDIEQDILPAMSEAMNKWKDITTVSYFRKAAYRKRDERREREMVQERVELRHSLPDAETELRRARMLAKSIRVLGVRHPDHVKWLEQYENTHGRVEL